MASNAAGTLTATVGRGIAIAYAPARGASSSLLLPYPAAGWGGGELVMAARGARAALWMYSGQSEVGYALIGLEPAVHLIAELPYVFGEGDAPRFTPNGRWLVMAYRGLPRWRDAHGTEVEDIDELPTTGAWRCDWLTIHGRDTATGEVHDAQVIVDVVDGVDDPDPDAWPGWQRLADVHDDHAVLALPWGTTIDVPVPPRAPVRVRYQRRAR